MTRIALLWIVVALLGGAVAAQEGSRDFRLEPGDQITISVLEDPGLNTTALVRPDGRISAPIVGALDVAGRTPESVAASIRRALAPSFLAPPTVTVALVGLGGRQPATFYILGEIARPGPHSFDGPTTVLQALAIAGGPSRFAATRRIQLRRQTGEGEWLFNFDYDVVERGLVPSQVIEMRDGDVIVVPVRGIFE